MGNFCFKPKQVSHEVLPKVEPTTSKGEEETTLSQKEETTFSQEENTSLKETTSSQEEDTKKKENKFAACEHLKQVAWNCVNCCVECFLGCL
jgi:hypothetical protein